MMIRPGSVMTVRPPSLALAALAAEVVEASRSGTAAHPGRWLEWRRLPAAAPLAAVR